MFGVESLWEGHTKVTFPVNMHYKIPFSDVPLEDVPPLSPPVFEIPATWRKRKDKHSSGWVYFQGTMHIALLQAYYLAEEHTILAEIVATISPETFEFALFL